MQVRFDSFDRFEQPKFYVCSPGCEYKKGVLTKVLGCLSDTSDEEFVVNFNTTSELNFRVNKVRRRDPDENEYAQMLYRALQNRRLIFVEDVGFFVIKNVTVGYDAGVNYKDIQALSCECELGDRVLPYIKDGTYKFTDLLEKIIASLPLWKIGDVNGDVADKYRTFEDVSEDKNALSFLLEDMQDAYECIFVFDDVNRIVSVYDQNAYVRDTQIHLTKNDLINSVEIKENSDDLYTAKGLQRGATTRAINVFLRRKDEHYQDRWDRVWDDELCQKYKRPEHPDHWLWNHEFYNADLSDLEYIENLIRMR